MTAIGIMQGRLIPPVRGIQAFPRDHWRDEFSAAHTAKLDFIEWIFDEYGADVNPLMTESGVREILSLSELTGVAVNSICADYFMDCPLLKCQQAEQDKRMDILNSLLVQGRRLGVSRIILPFVDASQIDSVEEENMFVTLIRDKILPKTENMNIEIHLETSLPPLSIASILDRIPHALFWINYDSGNSSSLGYKPEEEFHAYGKRIGSFHVKDRVLGGKTVPLGTGDTDFLTLAKCLREVQYQGPFVLQVARGESGHEIDWAQKNKSFIKEHLY